MDASEVRRDRLKQWLADEFDGKVASLCRYYAIPPATASYLSQLLSGHRVFGERAARKLEAQCRRPTGWLDSVEPFSAEKVLRFDSKRCAKLKVEDRELIEAFIALILERNDRLSEKVLSERRVRLPTGSEVKRAALKPIKMPYSEKDGGVRSTVKRGSSR